MHHVICSKTCVKQTLSKRLKIVFQDQISLNADQKYFRMLQHSAILLTFIKIKIVIKIFFLSIFVWLFYTFYCMALKRPCISCFFVRSLQPCGHLLGRANLLALLYVMFQDQLSHNASQKYCRIILSTFIKVNCY